MYTPIHTHPFTDKKYSQYYPNNEYRRIFQIITIAQDLIEHWISERSGRYSTGLAVHSIMTGRSYEITKIRLGRFHSPEVQKSDFYRYSLLFRLITQLIFEYKYQRSSSVRCHILPITFLQNCLDDENDIYALIVLYKTIFHF